MKTTFYPIIILAFLLLNACKSIEKLVDQGQYDKAIVLATKKLAGKKNKKTKQIIALEKAFAKVNAQDLGHIDFLKSKNDNANWEDIYDYILDIQDRQNRIIPFLPIISKNGYTGHFELIDTKPLLAEAGSKAAENLYLNGIGLIEHSRSTGNKLTAQDAYYNFNNIKRFFISYKDVDDLLTESERLGTFHVLLKWDETFRKAKTTHIPFDIHRMNRKWVKYHSDFVEGISFDVISTLFIDHIDISPEREIVNNFIETKEIEKWVDVVNNEGNVVKDSLGQVIQQKEPKIIRAFITEYIRSKSAIINARVESTDFISGRIIEKDLFRQDIIFESDACTFRGDRRAFSDRIRKRVDYRLLPFPQDFEMINEGLEVLQEKFKENVRNLDVSHHYNKSMVTIY